MTALDTSGQLNGTSNNHPPDEQIATIRQPSTGISVLIIGAGTAGAFAALECWRKGHDVRVFERAPGPYVMGAVAYRML